MEHTLRLDPLWLTAESVSNGQLRALKTQDQRALFDEHQSVEWMKRIILHHRFLFLFFAVIHSNTLFFCKILYQRFNEHFNAHRIEKRGSVGVLLQKNAIKKKFNRNIYPSRVELRLRRLIFAWTHLDFSSLAITLTF